MFVHAPRNNLVAPNNSYENSVSGKSNPAEIIRSGRIEPPCE